MELEPRGEGLNFGSVRRKEGIPGRYTEAGIGRSCERGSKETSWYGEPQKGELMGRGTLKGRGRGLEGTGFCSGAQHACEQTAGDILLFFLTQLQF